jgi:hypothetical protein
MRISCRQRQRGLWQATKRPSPAGVSTGGVVRHCGSAAGHRGWKRHPGGTFIGLGGSPRNTVRVGRASGSGTGMADNSACV